jgi:hypothetical protein
MRTRGVITAAILALAIPAAGASAATPSSTSLTQIRAVYRTVLTAEYFGPASGVCSHLTASGLKSFTAGGGGTCTHAFAQERQILTHKTKGVDDSGYTADQWRGLVNSVMSHLKVTIDGAHASAIGGDSGIPGRTTLVHVRGRWEFSSYPPSLSS